MLRADVGGSVYRGPVGFGHCAAQQEGGYECCGERVARTDSVGYFNARLSSVGVKMWLSTAPQVRMSARNP